MGALLASCGPGLTKPRFDVLAQKFTAAAAAKDAKALRAMMATSVLNGGLVFADATCSAFATPSDVKGPQLDELARCLAGLGLVESARKDALPDVAVMTYPPGFEVEARLIENPDRVTLAAIGLSARRADETAPTISAGTLEQLRIAGSPTPAIPGTAAVEHDIEIHDHAFAWFKVCLDAKGTITQVRPRLATSPGAARALGDAIKEWKFKPFVANDKPIPVCAMVQLADPPMTAVENLPIVLPAGTPDMLLVAYTSFGNLVRGKFEIAPSDDEKLELAKAGQERIIGSFFFCLDAAGKVTDVKLLRTTGVPSYDQRIETTMRGWEFGPYVDDGKPISPCSVLTLSYSQR